MGGARLFDMASKGQLKDMRRDDLIVPYAEPEKDKESNDMQSTMASTLPMAAMFTRNKLIGWTAVMFSIQGWLSETPDQRRAAPGRARPRQAAPGRARPRQ